MPNNMEGRGLTDREMVQLCLELEKGRCRGISNTIVETAHEELKDVYTECFNVAVENHRNLFDLLQQRGWYKVAKASQEQIEEMQNVMQNNLHPDNNY